MHVNLKDKVAIVTGSIQGIGRTAAETLGEAGAKVIINNHVDGDKLEAVAQEMRDKGGDVKAVVADVTKKESAQKLVDAALEMGGINILVNNAGGLVKRIPVAEFDQDHFHTVINVNLLSAFIMCNLVIPHMKEQKSGKIINFSSQAAHDGGGPGSAVYSSSKGAIWTMTKSLTKELGPSNINVNCIAPGFIGQTVFHDTFTPKETYEKVIGLIPLRRHGVPQDIANVVLFLASDLSNYITGQTLEVNGGLYTF